MLLIQVLAVILNFTGILIVKYSLFAFSVLVVHMIGLSSVRLRLVLLVRRIPVEVLLLPGILELHHRLGLDNFDRTAHSGVNAAAIIKHAKILEAHRERIVDFVELGRLNIDFVEGDNV